MLQEMGGMSAFSLLGGDPRGLDLSMESRLCFRELWCLFYGPNWL